MKKFKSEENLCNLVLYKKSVAIRFIENCKAEGKIIYGFDAFLIYDDRSIQPFLEYSKDYSSSIDIEPLGNWDRAIADIQQINKIYKYLVFEIVV